MLRKTLAATADTKAEDAASMRPQRNAAENHLSAVHSGRVIRASMRPQRNAAENYLSRDGDILLSPLQ